MSYAYANARVKGMKSKLLPAAKVRELLDVESVDAVVALLGDTAYKREFVECSARYAGAELVMRALYLNLARTIATLARILPEHAKPAFRTMAGEWVVEDLKRVLSKKALGREVSEEELALVDEQYNDLLRKLAKARDLKACAALLRGTPFGSAESLAELEGGKTKRFFEEAEAYYWRNVVENTAAANDAQLKAINRARLDAKNALIILRLKRDGIEMAEISKWLLPSFGSRYDALVEAAGLAEAVEESRKLLRVSDEAVEEAKKGRLSTLEIETEKRLVERVLKESRISSLGLAAVIGFLYLKSTEVGNIRKIAYGTHYGLKEELEKTVFAVKAS